MISGFLEIAKIINNIDGFNMHPSAFELGKKFFSTYCQARSEFILVDIGAQNVNGSLKELCVENARYIGVDFEDGKDVDIVLDDPYSLPFEDSSVDVIVCSSVFEHSQFFWLVFLEMLRVLKEDGLIYLNVPSNGYYHYYPVDCWRFYPDSGDALVAWGERNGYEPALLESFIAEKKCFSIKLDAWNDFVAVFVKDKRFRKKYPKRIIHSVESYYNSYCDDGKTDGRYSSMPPDFLELLKLSEENSDYINNIEKLKNIIEGLNKSVNERDLLIDNLSRECELRVENITRECELLAEDLKHELSIAKKQLLDLSRITDELRLFHDTVLNSTIWKLSSPLRKINPKYVFIIKLALKLTKDHFFIFLKLLLPMRLKGIIKNFLYGNFSVFFRGTPSYEFWKYLKSSVHISESNVRIYEDLDEYSQKMMLPSDLSFNSKFRLPACEVDVIIPVYRGAGQTKRCIDSVLSSSSKTSFRVLIINDASPDEELREYLCQLPESDRLIILENKENLGFTATVNRGMSYSDTNDVILLNSDTEVANDWIDRLKAQAWSGFRIGTVTPFSNNATICSYPTIQGTQFLPDDYTVKDIDAAFAEVNIGKSINIPTAVGFCMYIRRECIKDVGLFDVETFGKGYGEENDFCLRASSLGWTHLLGADVFVYHEGEVSFKEESNLRKKNASAIIRQRYPLYEGLVAKHVSENKIMPLKVAATAALFKNSGRPVVLHILHSYGGGTQKHVNELCKKLESNAKHLILKPATDEQAGKPLISIQASDPYYALDLSIEADKSDFILSLVKSFGVSLIHIHHIIGYSFDIHDFIKSMNLPFYLTIHDYYFICPRIHLLNSDYQFCGDTDLSTCKICTFSNPASIHSDIVWWREKNAWLFNDAAMVICPSYDVLRRFLEYYPYSSFKVVAHEKETDNQSVCNKALIAPETPLRIVLLGSLSKHKGLDLLSQALLISEDKKLPLCFNLIGFVTGPIPKVSERLFPQTGSYDDADLPDMIEKIDPHLILFLSRCPETYSYTLSAALNSGRPIMAPMLGAFPERLQSRPWTWLYDWNIGPEALVDSLCAIRRDNFLNQTPPEIINIENIKTNQDSFFYDEKYLSIYEKSENRNHVVDLKIKDKISIVVVLNTKGNHPDACAYIRLILPLIRERGDKLHVRWITPDEVFAYAADILICQRVAVADIDMIDRIVEHSNKHNMKIVYDLDDYLLELPKDHPEFLIYKPLSEAVFNWLLVADDVWVSTKALMVHLKNINSRVHLVPNYLDDYVWSNPKKNDVKKITDCPVRLLYMGTQTHQADFELVTNVLRRLKEEFGPNIEIFVIGISAADLNNSWCQVLNPPDNVGAVYPAFANWLAETNCFDIGIAPLVDNTFNRCKSPIKFFDYSAIGLATVASDIGVYDQIQDGENGVLAKNTEDSWYHSLRKLITDEEFRNKVQCNASKEVYEKFGYRSVMNVRTDLLKNLLSRSTP